MKENRKQSVRRRAFILVAVLGLAVLVAVLGLTFLDTHSTVMPEAENRKWGLRAQYAAESGIATATRFLMYPPLKDGNPMPLDTFYGDNDEEIRIVVDENPYCEACEDYADVKVKRPNDAKPNLYRITSTGVAHSYDGTTVGARRTITTEIIVPVTDKWEIDYALVNRTALDVPSGVKVTGGMRANGGVKLYAGSSYSGDVWSTEKVQQQVQNPLLELEAWPYLCACEPLLAPPNINCCQPVYETPAGTTSKTDEETPYENYVINGRSYTAHTYNKSSMNKADADALNGILDSTMAKNPGRIVVCTGENLNLQANTGSVHLKGALIVTNGRLEFKDAGDYVISAELDYPALVLAGDLRVNSDGANVTIVGSVLCEGDLDFRQKSALLTIDGSLIKTGTFKAVRTDSDESNPSLDVKWDDIRSSFWDLESPTLPVTVLSWKGN